MLRRLTVFAALALVIPSLVATAAATPAGESGAGEGGAVEECLVEGTVEYSPGLTTRPQPVDITFSDVRSPCRGAEPSAQVQGTAFAPELSCSGGPASGKADITWASGKTSTMEFQTAGRGVPVKVTGTVTSGQFAGEPVEAHLFFFANGADCFSPGGLKTASFRGSSRTGGAEH